MLLKWKNIAKTLYCRSKSRFSHIRNEVEKATLNPLILERFWEPKSSQYREKVVLNSIWKIIYILIRFCIDFWSILDLLGDPKIVYFSTFWALVVAPAPLGRQEGSQSAPREPQTSILKDLGPFWARFLTKSSQIHVSIIMKKCRFRRVCIYIYISRQDVSKFTKGWLITHLFIAHLSGNIINQAYR